MTKQKISYAEAKKQFEAFRSTLPPDIDDEEDDDDEDYSWDNSLEEAGCHD